MATLAGMSCKPSGILARNFLVPRILFCANRNSSEMSREKLEKIQQRVEGEIKSFTSRQKLEFLAEDYSPHIVFEDGYAGDKVLGIFNYQLRLLKYNTFVHLRSAGTMRNIEKSEIDVINRTITVTWDIILAPGWSLVFFFGLFGWFPVLFRKVFRSKSKQHEESASSDTVHHFFISKFIFDEKGRMTRHILTRQKTLTTPEEAKKM